MKKGKTGLIIAIIIIVVVLAVAAIFAVLFLTTDMFKTGQQAFIEAITKNTENFTTITSDVFENQEDLKGNLRTFAYDNKINESIFKAMLVKMGLSQFDFDTNIQDMSEGQKKKVLIAKSISEQANIYIWDEPLNYIDILTREQIEDAILNYNPTIIFVEHDEKFIEKVATKIINLVK